MIGQVSAPPRIDLDWSCCSLQRPSQWITQHEHRSLTDKDPPSVCRPVLVLTLHPVPFIQTSAPPPPASAPPLLPHLLSDRLLAITADDASQSIALSSPDEPTRGLWQLTRYDDNLEPPRGLTPATSPTFSPTLAAPRPTFWKPPRSTKAKRYTGDRRPRPRPRV